MMRQLPQQRDARIAALWTQRMIDSEPRRMGFPITPPAATFLPLIVTGVENNYLKCKRIDDEGNPTGSEILVAKPPELRHEAKWYQGITSITTNSAQSVQVSSGSGSGAVTETWTVRPPYLANTTVIVAVPVAGGLGVPDSGVNHLDLNIAGRVWGFGT